ncbi:hypothetical protein [Methanopyrus sp.]
MLGVRRPSDLPVGKVRSETFNDVLWVRFQSINSERVVPNRGSERGQKRGVIGYALTEYVRESWVIKLRL